MPGWDDADVDCDDDDDVLMATNPQAKLRLCHILASRRHHHQPHAREMLVAWLCCYAIADKGKERKPKKTGKPVLLLGQ